ncbi:MAG: hypothetical protein E6J34_16415 [Chloroflexi bacterium]|nr:MAG: hypothetical protein E6J34_16415 [Chloroflexota bacterium]
MASYSQYRRCMSDHRRALKRNVPKLDDRELLALKIRTHVNLLGNADEDDSRELRGILNAIEAEERGRATGSATVDGEDEAPLWVLALMGRVAKLEDF